jgi:hypothetical protein
MFMRSELSCWEMIQCNKKDNCPRCSEEKKSCWELVKEDNACSFHVCIDCLVYLATRKNPFFSKNKVSSILKQRQDKGLARYECRLSAAHSESSFSG